MMGYFTFLTEVKAEQKRIRSEAKAKAASIGHDLVGLEDIGWESVERLAFMEALYRQVAEKSKDFAELLSHLQDALSYGNKPAIEALLSQDLGALRPLLAARLHGGEKAQVLNFLKVAYSQFPEPLAHLRVLTQEESQVGVLAHAVLAYSPHEEDRTFVLAKLSAGALPKKADRPLRYRIILAGNTTQDEWLLETLQQLINEGAEAPEQAVQQGTKRRLSREKTSPLIPLLNCIVKRDLKAAAPLLTELLYTFDTIEVLQALGSLKNPETLNAIRNYRNNVVGDPIATAPFCVAAEHALTAFGETQSPDTARFVLQKLHHQAYGYPKEEDLVMLHCLAAEILLAQGDPADVAFLKTWIHSADSIKKGIGLDAYEQLHGERPALSHYEESRIKDVLEQSGEEALRHALFEPGSTNQPLIARTLLEASSAKVRESAARWIREVLENTPNHYAKNTGSVKDSHAKLLRALDKLDDTEKRNWLGDTTSAWIKAFVLRVEELTYPPESSWQSDGVTIEVDQLDRAPFVFGSNINMVKLSPDDQRLAVVGQGFGKIIDAQTGDVLLTLELRLRSVCHVAWSPDGQTLAICAHGGHVRTYHAQTGSLLQRFTGHAGVPYAVKQVLFSPGGDVLLSAGQDAQVFAWDPHTGDVLWHHQAASGSYEALCLSGDGKQVIASHVKTTGEEDNFLSIFAIESGFVRDVKMPVSVWSIAISPDGSTFAMGTEDSSVYLYDSDLQKQRTLKQAAVTRIVFSSDGTTLCAVSEHGVLRTWQWQDPNDEEGEAVWEGDESLWTLDISSKNVVSFAGKDGTVYHDPPNEQAQLEGVHQDQICAFLPQQDSGCVIGDWSGKILRWSPEWGTGSPLWNVEGSLEDAYQTASGHLVVATRSGLFLLNLQKNTMEAEFPESVDVMAVNVEETEIAIGQRHSVQFLDLATLHPKGEPLLVGTNSVASLCALSDGSYLAGTEAGEVSKVAEGERKWTIADHGSDRLEYGKSHKTVCSIVARPNSQGFVSGASDGVVRIYKFDQEGRPVQQKRILEGFGRFNRLSLSHQGHLLALPTSSSLHLYTLPEAKKLFTIHSQEHFRGEEINRVKFAGDQTILVGTESGRIFRVTFTGERA